MLKDILVISGKPGIFKMVSQAKSHVIVESLDDNKRLPIHSFTKISALQDIAIYTDYAEVPLEEIMVTIFKKEEGKESSVKANGSGKDIKAYFEEILPEYDRDRVYVSDMKKVIRWYNDLLQFNLIDPEAYEKAKAEAEAAEKAEESKEPEAAE